MSNDHHNHNNDQYYGYLQYLRMIPQETDAQFLSILTHTLSTFLVINNIQISVNLTTNDNEQYNVCFWEEQLNNDISLQWDYTSFCRKIRKGEGSPVLGPEECWKRFEKVNGNPVPGLADTPGYQSGRHIGPCEYCVQSSQFCTEP